MGVVTNAFEAPVGDDGTLVVQAAELARHGLGPGDIVRIEAVRKRSRVSRLGARRRPLRFAQEHLDEIRGEMGRGLGEDLTR